MSGPREWRETWGARALELAERLGDTEALVYALTNIGSAELRAGQQQGRDKLERALRWPNSTASRIMPHGHSTAW
jgi:hypothetical protein